MDPAGWGSLIERVGLTGALCAGFLYVTVKHLIPAFMGEIERNRETLSRQVDQSVKNEQENIAKFTVVMERQQDLTQAAIQKLDRLSTVIDKQSSVIQNLAAQVRIAHPAEKKRPAKKESP